MKKRWKVLLVVALSMGLLAVGIFFYLQSFRPQLRGKLEISGLKAEVETYFDDFGIPHIYAANGQDAYRAFGYIHAQDRLFQMELMRRAGSGRLAEIFGADLTKADAFFRTIGTPRKAKEDAEAFDALPTALKAHTLAYLDGINQFIASGKVPLEYRLIGVEPEPFTVEDIYSIAGYMAYSFAHALRTDPVVEFVSQHLDSTYLSVFDLALGEGAPMSDSTTLAIGGPIAAFTSGSSLLDQLPLPAFQGSNSWAIGGSKSASGLPLLANDTHIKFAAPAVWYEAHIEYPGFSIYGNFLAGIPYALIGHSRDHAWGITMFENDDTDFFYENFAFSDSSATIFADSLTKPVVKYQELIKVKDGQDSTFTIYHTANGPLINHFLPVKSDEPVSMYWTYTHIPNMLLEAFEQMNYAGEMSDFRKGVSMIGAPGLNITYADRVGNIALWSSGKQAMLPTHLNGKNYGRGYAAEDTLHGFYSFEHNPQSINPGTGYVWTANEAHPNTDGSVYPGYYVPPTRSQRISSLLDTNASIDIAAMKGIILDHVSKTEEKVAMEIAVVLKLSENNFNLLEKGAIEKLASWTGAHSLDQAGPTIYYAVLYEIILAAMHDEMGSDVFDSYLQTHLYMRSYPKLIKTENTPWWDNLNTPDVVETREDIIVDALQKAMARLELEYGKNLKYWEWGRTHTLEHPHPLGSVSLLRPFFNVGPFPAPGGKETVNNAGFPNDSSNVYKTAHGPAMRILIDFNDVEHALSILPTGNSGNVMSPHYDDQALMFVNGEFREMKMNEAEIKSSNNKLVLKPN